MDIEMTNSGGQVQESEGDAKKKLASPQTMYSATSSIFAATLYFLCRGSHRTLPGHRPHINTCCSDPVSLLSIKGSAHETIRHAGQV